MPHRGGIQAKLEYRDSSTQFVHGARVTLPDRQSCTVYQHETSSEFRARSNLCPRVVRLSLPRSCARFSRLAVNRCQSISAILNASSDTTDCAECTGRFAPMRKTCRKDRHRRCSNALGRRCLAWLATFSDRLRSRSHKGSGSPVIVNGLRGNMAVVIKDRLRGRIPAIEAAGELALQ